MTTASTERVFKLGAKAVCKDCSRPTVTAGVWALVVALHEAGKKADIALFATEAEADAGATWLSGAGATTTAAMPPALKKSMNNSMTSASNFIVDVDEVTEAAPAVSPYHGKVVKGINLPIFNGTIFIGQHGRRQDDGRARRDHR